ncbi:MAG: PepSY-like domain-containing protein [Ignavibacteriae bacterium]|nr:PepSY-like domain-containing protein [Ignavibacteriota bacterium]
MKRVLLILMICAATVSFAQTKVPDKVKSAFEGKFPNATSVKWETDDDDYTAEFTSDSINYYTTFADDGKWQETGVMIAYDILPDAVKKSVKDKFKDNEIKRAYKVDDLNGIVSYEVDIIKDGKIIELYFNKDGSDADDD